MSLTNLKKAKDNKRGFTIIEVLIVLAIAGLILLIVFIAVPALQRNQRNSGRKSDAGHISTAINDYVSNNNGTLPSTTTANWPGLCKSIMTDAGALSQYNLTTGSVTTGSGVACSGSGTFTIGEFNAKVATGNGTTSSLTVTNNNSNGALLLEDATCSTNNGTTVSYKVGSSSQAVLIYTLESGSTTVNEACITVE